MDQEVKFIEHNEFPNPFVNKKSENTDSYEYT